MKRIIVVSALACVAADAVAQSSVTLFGYIGAGVRWTDGVKGGSQVGFDNNAISGNIFGIKGAEDLGGGMQAIFMLQSGFLTGSGALAKSPGLLFSQMAYVGLSGPYGRVTFGRQLNALEDIGIALDPNSAQGQSLSTIPGVVWGGNFFTNDSRFNNTIKYVGTFGGATVRGSYSPGGVAGNQRAGSNVAVGTSYRFRTLLLGAAYQTTWNADASQWARTIMGGASWQVGPARLYLSYSDLAVSAAKAGAPERRDRIPAVGIVYQVTPFLQLSGATYYDFAQNLKNAAGADGRKLTSYAMLQYFLSKRTSLYAEFDRNGFSGAYKKDQTNIGGLSLRPDGRTVTGVSVGMITQF
ncbi:porin [Burkholderia cenocepacia]|uniref:porin n=1 Tax=Burkholderia cepacia complex TaxID=87882 RepID=UPI001B9D8DD3|nr:MULTISPECIES: porin [Burkholderia cepacia complex]MBR8374438.1 porin [Burkholderia cenocepacia]MDN7560192.1 porin [Burkholderia orbicola]